MLQKVKTQLSKGNKITIEIFITPKSSKNEIIDIQTTNNQKFIIKAKIKGIPEKGKVNTNLINFLAKELHSAKSNIVISKGQTSRHKTLIIST